MSMTSLRSVPIFLTLTLIAACSGDDGDDTGAGTDTSSGTDGTTGSTSDGTETSSTSEGTSTTGTTEATTDTTTGDTTTDSSSTSTTTTDSGGTAGACSSVVVTYDLTGSTIFIDAIQDFTITVQEPYNEDLNTGPGTMKIRFVDDGAGNPVAGTAQIIDYSLKQNFVTGSPALATVTTNIDTTSGPDACGTATGMFDGGALAWDAPAQMDPYCRDGMVSCAGSFCGQGGSPPENMPIVFNNDCSAPQALGNVTFSNGVDSFASDPAVVAMDNNQTTTVTLVGTATDTTVDENTPACACP